MVINNINISSNIVLEKELPFPHVYYPPLYGTFFSFSKTIDDNPFFCLCSKDSILNFLELKKLQPYGSNTNPLVNKPLPLGHFHSYWAEKFDNENFSIEKLDFEDKLCHRCNLKTPYLNNCHPMYGGNFKQKYGWYIKQNFYKVGIDGIYSSNYLDFVPQELKDIIINRNQFINEGQKYRDPDPNEFSKELFLKRTEIAKKGRNLSNRLNNLIENITRKEFGMA